MKRVVFLVGILAAAACVFLFVQTLARYRTFPMQWWEIHPGLQRPEVETALGGECGPEDIDMKGTLYKKMTFFGDWQMWLNYENGVLVSRSIMIHVGSPPDDSREVIYFDSIDD